MSIAVNPPRTPVTAGSRGTAPATTPNVCKMPGPPAPFVPTPLPNIGQTGDSLSGGTNTVKFEGKKVAIKGSTFKSTGSGDVASQGTGGGIISARTQGKTEWIAPGSMDVKAEGKNIQLLGDAMANNGGSPVNAATMKELQDAVGLDAANDLCVAICTNYGSGRGQSKRAEEQFLGSKAGKGWKKQHSVDLTGGGKCRPDLYCPALKLCVELKAVGEAFTPRQLQFQDELEKGQHKCDYMKVTPETCNCPKT